MPADGLTKGDYKASLYLRDVMDKAWFSWILDEGVAERKAAIKEQRTKCRKENNAKKIKEASKAASTALVAMCSSRLECSKREARAEYERISAKRLAFDSSVAHLSGRERHRLTLEAHARGDLEPLLAVIVPEMGVDFALFGLQSQFFDFWDKLLQALIWLTTLYTPYQLLMDGAISWFVDLAGRTVYRWLKWLLGLLTLCFGVVWKGIFELPRPPPQRPPRPGIPVSNDDDDDDDYQSVAQSDFGTALGSVLDDEEASLWDDGASMASAFSAYQQPHRQCNTAGCLAPAPHSCTFCGMPHCATHWGFSPYTGEVLCTNCLQSGQALHACTARGIQETPAPSFASASSVPAQHEAAQAAIDPAQAAVPSAPMLPKASLPAAIAPQHLPNHFDVPEGVFYVVVPPVQTLQHSVKEVYRFYENPDNLLVRYDGNASRWRDPKGRFAKAPEEYPVPLVGGRVVPGRRPNWSADGWVLVSPVVHPPAEIQRPPPVKEPLKGRPGGNAQVPPKELTPKAPPAVPIPKQLQPPPMPKRDPPTCDNPSDWSAFFNEAKAAGAAKAPEQQAPCPEHEQSRLEAMRRHQEALAKRTPGVMGPDGVIYKKPCGPPKANNIAHNTAVAKHPPGSKIPQAPPKKAPASIPEGALLEASTPSFVSAQSDNWFDQEVAAASFASAASEASNASATLSNDQRPRHPDGHIMWRLIPPCPSCGHEMKYKQARHGGSFFGCSLYPKCKGTRSQADVAEWRKRHYGTG